MCNKTKAALLERRVWGKDTFYSAIVWPLNHFVCVLPTYVCLYILYLFICTSCDDSVKSGFSAITINKITFYDVRFSGIHVCVRSCANNTFAVLSLIHI